MHCSFVLGEVQAAFADIIWTNQVNSDLSVTVRAPRLASKKDIDRFIEEKETWICKHIEEIKKKKERYEAEKSEKLTHEELTALADKALDIIPRRVEYFAKRVVVKVI